MTHFEDVLRRLKVRDLCKVGSLEVDTTSTFTGELTCSDLTCTGTFTFGDAAADTLILKGRMSTMTAAGSSIQIDATTCQYGEGMEMRYNLADWADTYTITAAKGLYLRMETNEASSNSLYGTEIYGVTNNVNIGSLWGALVYAYVKGASAKTITNVYALQPEITFDAGSAANTITDACVVRAKVTGGVMSDYTVLDGFRLTLGDMDGGSRTYGNGLIFEDDSDMSGTCALTTGININIGTTTAISIAGTCTTGLSITSSTTAISFGKGAGSIVDAAASLTIYGGNTTGDALVLQGNSADAGQKITITGASGTAVTGDFSCTGDVTLSKDSCTLTHSGSTSLTITSTSGTVAVESVTFTGAAISGVSTIGMSGDLTLSANSANITHSGSTTLAIVSTSGTVSVEDITFTGATMSHATAAGITAPTITLAASTKLDVNGMLDVSDELAGGASNGSVIKKTLQAGEVYTGTTAGVMIKMYGDATATVPSGEYTGLYVNLKGLHVDPGHNTSLISAHVHGSNTTTVHAGLWLYGDMTNGLKASGSTLTNMVDLSEATAVTNLVALPAAGTAPCSSETTADYTFTNYIKVACTIGGTTYYLIADRS